MRWGQAGKIYSCSDPEINSRFSPPKYHDFFLLACLAFPAGEIATKEKDSPHISSSYVSFPLISFFISPLF